MQSIDSWRRYALISAQKNQSIERMRCLGTYKKIKFKVMKKYEKNEMRAWSNYQHVQEYFLHESAS